MSVSKSLKEGLNATYGLNYEVKIIDFVELINSILNLVTQKNYDTLVKFAPKLYKLLYESTSKQVQLIKLFNQLNYPFVITKIKTFFEELAAEIWKKHKPEAKFITIITDSISIHKSWTIADSDYYIVANKDTAEVLEKKLNVEKGKTKILGFPVKRAFSKPLTKEEKNKILKDLNLKKDIFTILLLPTAQSIKKTNYILKNLNEIKEELNIIIITGRDKKIKPKIEKFKFNKNLNTKIIGWTNKISDYLKTSDVVITKAGGPWPRRRKCRTNKNILTRNNKHISNARHKRKHRIH